jgi:multicomponent Na+:H+ antiporter subunit F
VLLECFGEELDPPAISKAPLEKSVITIFFVASLLIAVTMGLSLYRAVAGPGVFNRVAAVNIVGTKTIVLLVVMGYYFERPYFFDIALLYGMINFIGTLIFAKYLERGELWS